MARCAFSLSLSLSVNKKGEGPKCIWLRLSAVAKIIQTANGSNFSHTQKEGQFSVSYISSRTEVDKSKSRSCTPPAGRTFSLPLTEACASFKHMLKSIGPIVVSPATLPRSLWSSRTEKSMSCPSKYAAWGKNAHRIGRIGWVCD